MQAIDVAAEIRARTLVALYHAGSGHPGASLSVADIVASLFFGEIDFNRGDKFILSKGHAVPSVYAALSLRGDIKPVELETLRKVGSRLQGHPVAGTVPHIDVSTGSLGQGLSMGVGMAYGIKMNGSDARVYVVLGDGELQEGQNWEAFMSASKFGLENLVAIVDNNGFQNDGRVADIMPIDPLDRRLESFGWNVLRVDGHDIEQLNGAYALTRSAGGKPSAIIADTVKGRGVQLMESNRKRHNSIISREELAAAMRELGRGSNLIPTEIISDGEVISSGVKELATRDAFGEALINAGGRYDKLVVVDCDLGGATKARGFKEHFPTRFIEVGIAEQNGVGIAAGLAKQGFRPVITSFGAFLTNRAMDQIMNSVAYSGAGVILVGTHSGLAIGKDGATQMGISDINAMRGIPGMEIYSPADSIETRRIVEYLVGRDTPAYLRLSRRPQPPVHDETYRFNGRAVIFKEGRDVTLVSTGDMVYHALQSAAALGEERIEAGVVNVSSICPFDADTVISIGGRSKGIVTLEDHSIVGGLGTCVAEAVAERGLGIPVLRHGIRGFGESGDPADLYRKHQLDLEGITAIVKKFYLNLR